MDVTRTRTPRVRKAVRGIKTEFLELVDVMPGLVPGIHAAPPLPLMKGFCNGAAWTARTSPAMTVPGCMSLSSMSPSRSCRGRAPVRRA
jgi:hypothetical protein